VWARLGLVAALRVGYGRGAPARSHRSGAIERSPVKRRCGTGVALFLTAWAGFALARQATSEAPPWEYDPENARDILETGAACHGKNGEGGKNGTYPRLAGLKADYIAKHLRAFKARDRANIPMYPYATERELPASDVLDVARLLSEIELPTEMPALEESMSALERLRAAQAVFNVPRVEGDVERGAELYENECGDCHGEDGWGDGDAPQLAGQHTEYLRRQVESFQSDERVNEDMEGILDGLDDESLQDLFAYLASRDD
jgi:cytochrome c553